MSYGITFYFSEWIKLPIFLMNRCIIMLNSILQWQYQHDVIQLSRKVLIIKVFIFNQVKKRLTVGNILSNFSDVYTYPSPQELFMMNAWWFTDLTACNPTITSSTAHEQMIHDSTFTPTRMCRHTHKTTHTHTSSKKNEEVLSGYETRWMRLRQLASILYV